MYHKASISPLSSTQISKILNGHSVRVSPGNKHDIELSKEQFKKFSKAHKNGKAMTLTMDPYQIQNHQHLRGSGNVKATAKDSGKRLIVASTDRAVQAIEGSGIASNLFVRANQKDAVKAANRYGLNYQTPQEHTNIFGYGIGGNITSTSKDSGKRLIVASTDRAVRAIDGSGINDIRRPFFGATNTAINGMTGSSVNRMKKATRWEGFANRTVRDGIDTAGKAARVYYDSTGPMAKLGFGLKKRTPRKRRGGALYPAGSYY
jgi:hypothetical protein